MNLNNPKILAFFDFFYPAFKSGGPARSSLGLIETMSVFFNFAVYTRNTDIDYKQPLNGILSDKWINIKEVKVFYSTSFIHILKAIKKIEYDLYYFNSFFSIYFTIIPLLFIRFGMLPQKLILIAPRGEFSANALMFKKRKKKFYLKIFKLLFKNNIIYHASSNIEKWDIIRATGVKYEQVRIALNLRPISEFYLIQNKFINKKPGELKLVCISRISPMKNIDFAINILMQCKSNIIFDLYGIIDNIQYWQECKKKIALLPQNIKIEYKGEVLQSEVYNILQNYHVMFLPTQGENFGHSIFESFMARRPVLISDVTIWSDLEQLKAGWDLSLHNEKRFIDKLEELNAMDNYTYEQFVSGAYQIAINYFSNNENIERYKKLFEIKLCVE